MPNEAVSESIVSEVPTDEEAPRLYDRTVLELGIIALVCVLIVGVLTALGVNSEAAVTGLVAIASMSVGGLVRMLEPRQK